MASEEQVLTSLLDGCGDSESSVRRCVRDALVSVGKRRPDLVLSTAQAHFAKRKTALSSLARAEMLSVMEAVCDASLGSLDDDLAQLLINLAVHEITASKEIEDAWQTAGINLLCTLSRRWGAAVVPEALHKFPPGHQPHVQLLKALGQIALTNARCFVPFTGDVLDRTVPLLATAKQEQLRVAHANAIRNYCDSICEYISRSKDSSAPQNSDQNGVTDVQNDDVTSTKNSGVTDEKLDTNPFGSDGESTANELEIEKSQKSSDGEIHFSPGYDKKISKSLFESRFGQVYDTLFGHWLSSKQAPVRAASAECLGAVCGLISDDKLNEEMRKVLIAFLAFYKKSGTDLLPVTQGVYRLLEAARQCSGSPVQHYLEDVWIALFPIACEESTFGDHEHVRLRNEALRCFTVTAHVDADRLVYYLVQKAQTGADKQKLGAVAVLRHLLNSAGPLLAQRRSLVMRGILPVMHDGAPAKVKRSLALLSVALADHELLDGDSGPNVIQFLARNLIAPDDAPGRKGDQAAAATDGAAMRSQCASALLTIARNNEHVHPLLWPYLWEFVCVERYADCLNELMQCLTLLAKCSADKGEPVYIGTLPSVTEEGGEDAAHVPAAAENQSQEDKDAGQRHYESIVLKLLLDIVVLSAEGVWRQQLAAAFAQQLHLYAHHPDDKRFTLRCLGGVLTKVADKQFVLDHVELMFRSSDHGVASERIGCASAVGYVAAEHAELVLNKLENVAKWEHQKKQGGFMAFFKGMRVPPVRYIPADMRAQRLDTTVLRFVPPYFEQAKETVVRECVLQTMSLIAEAVGRSRLGVEYTLSERHAFLGHIMDFLKAEPVETMSTGLRLLAARAAGNLISLEPVLSEVELRELLNVITKYIICVENIKLTAPVFGAFASDTPSLLSHLHSVYSLSLSASPSMSTLSLLLRLLQPYVASGKDFERARAMTSALFVLRRYYEAAADCAIGVAAELGVLGGILARYCPRFADTSPEVRLAALDCVRAALRCAALLRGLGKDYKDSSLSELDSWRDTLRQSFGAEGAAFGLSGDGQQPHLNVVSKIAVIVEQRLPKSQVQTYISVLFDVMLDTQATVACAAAMLLCDTLTRRGHTLAVECEKIVTTLVERLSSVTSLHAYADALPAVQCIGAHHLRPTAQALLAHPLPYSQAAADCWQALARAENLTAPLIDWLLAELADCQTAAYETEEGCAHKFARPVALALSAASLEIVKGAEPEQAVLDAVPRLVAVLTTHCVTLADTAFPFHGSQVTPELRKSYSTPSSICHTSLKSVLLRARADGVLTQLNERRAWLDLESPQHCFDAVHELGRAVAQHNPQWVPELVQLVMPLVKANGDAQRCTAVALLSAFVQLHPDERGDRDPQLLATLVPVPQSSLFTWPLRFYFAFAISLLYLRNWPLVDVMLEALADHNLAARKLAVRGMGDLAHAPQDSLQRWAGAALGAVMAGLDDPADHRDLVALEAMHALNKLAAKLAAEHIKPILLNVLLRIRPCFEKDSGALRAVSFRLMGSLAAFAHSSADSDTTHQQANSRTAYTEQLHTNAVAILLHLFDEEPQVQMACVFVLLESAQLWGEGASPQPPAAETQPPAIVNRHLKPELAPSSSVYRVWECPQAACNYFKGTRPRIRANAALLVGALLGPAPTDLRSTVSTELVFAGLSSLLHENEPEVRQCAADAVAALAPYF